MARSFSESMSLQEQKLLTFMESMSFYIYNVSWAKLGLKKI